MKKLLISLLMLTLCLSFAACSSTEVEGDIWQDALYTEDTELGEGKSTVTVNVTAGDKTVVFTIHTDEKTVGAALEEHNLVDGEKSTYGLYVKAVNGIVADYDIDGTYWAFTQNGESMPTGVDGAEFQDGDKFELTRTK